MSPVKVERLADYLQVTGKAVIGTVIASGSLLALEPDRTSIERQTR